MTVKSVILAVSLLGLMGCVSHTQKEARCKCFGPDGQPTGNCQFEPLTPAEPRFELVSNATQAPLANLRATKTGRRIILAQGRAVWLNKCQ